jgi:hypothetical protein
MRGEDVETDLVILARSGDHGAFSAIRTAVHA